MVGFDTFRPTRILAEVSKRRGLIKRYIDYWHKLTPRTTGEVMDRWVFSVLSYLNTWSNNVRCFKACQELGYPLSRLGQQGLINQLQRIGSGLHARRGKTLYLVDKAFWHDSAGMTIQASESLQEYRQRLKPMAFGLWPAKLSFVLEMMYPESCSVVCIDRHMLDIYGLKGSSVSETIYMKIEAHWVGLCRHHGIPSPIARHIVWDQKRRIASFDNRYWSHVFEDPELAKVGYYNIPKLSYRKPIRV